MPPRSAALRISAIFGLVLLLFTALLVRLWYLQVLATEELQLQANVFQPANRVVHVPILADRGRILDINGRVLVDNRKVNVVTLDARVVREQLSETQFNTYLLQLAREISRHGRPIKVSEIANRVNDQRYGIDDQIPIAYDVREEFAIIVGERGEELPGVRLQETSIRDYPYGSLAAHVLGYVGSLTQEEAAAREGHPKRYQANDEIGKAGIELAFEDVLRGTPGFLERQISSAGRVVSERQTIAPQVGHDVQLTIDINLQALVEQQLRQGLLEAQNRVVDLDEQEAELVNPALPAATYPAPAGAAVLTNPETGAVLAMASYPSYDPSQFVLGISDEQFAKLVDPESYAPFNNRAIAGAYSIGSAMKPFTAYAGLSAGLIGSRGYVDAYGLIEDTGSHILQDCQGQCEFSNARGESYGYIDLPLSLIVSSDVYYYKLAEEFATRPGFDSEQVQKTAQEFGFGASTGIALPFEFQGLVPDAAIKRQRHEVNPDAFPDPDWRVGDTLNIAIGQGDMAATPLQLANAVSVFANGGSLYASNIAQAVIDPLTQAQVISYTPRQVRSLYLPQQIRQPITEALVGVTSYDRGGYSGTALQAFAGFPTDWPVAGKTGTVEVFDKNDSSVFMAYGPADNPQYAMAVVLEEAGFGGRAAAPVVRQVLEAIATEAVPVAVS